MSGLFPQIKINSDRPGPRGLIIAGIHGDEYEPVMTILQLKKRLRGVLTKGSLTLVPVVNQEAFFNRSRTGADAKDLARTCPGMPDGSLTEKVAYQISNLIRTSDFLVDMHTGGNVFKISPMTGYMLHPDESVLKVQREMAKAFNLPITWGTHPEMEGRTLSVARDASKPAIYTEYGGGGYDPTIVNELVKGCLNVLSYFGMIETHQSEKNRIQYEVEDYRKGSGHLQVMYPSPQRGVFSPSVMLGNTVQRGDLLGVVADLIEGSSLSIHAEEAGLVFLLRAVPAVCEGEALAGLLPINGEGRVTIR